MALCSYQDAMPTTLRFLIWNIDDCYTDDYAD